MSPLPLLGVLAVWLVVAATVVAVTPDAAALVDGPTIAFVAALPLVLAAVVRSPRAVGTALRHGLSGRLANVPADARAASASVLRSLGGTSFATGVVCVFSAFIALLNSMAAEGGEVRPSRLVAGIGALVLGPLYGLALKAFLYDPLATRVADEEGALGAALDDDAA